MSDPFISLPSFDKIEDYENPFSDGNFKNLGIIKRILEKENKKPETSTDKQ